MGFLSLSLSKLIRLLTKTHRVLTDVAQLNLFQWCVIITELRFKYSDLFLSHQ